MELLAHVRRFIRQHDLVCPDGTTRVVAAVSGGSDSVALLRLTRGAGMRGLAGMHPQTGVVIRPLLGCRRAALRAWLQEQAMAFVDDDSNADVAIPRNRIRAELLPLLESRFNPAMVDILA